MLTSCLFRSKAHCLMLTMVPSPNPFTLKMATSALVETLGYLNCYTQPNTEGRPTALPSVCSSIRAVASSAYFCIKRNSLRTNSHVAWLGDKASCIMKLGAVWMWVGGNGKKSQGLQLSAIKPDFSELSSLVDETFWQVNSLYVIICHFVLRLSTAAVDPVANNKLTRIISGKAVVTLMGGHWWNE